MVTVLSGVSTSLLIGGPEDDFLRMCAGLQHQQQQQQQQLVRNQNLYSHGMAPNHRYNAKASAIVHRCQMKNIHMRSQSMPEDAYLKYNLQQQQIQRHPSQLYNNSNNNQALPQHQQLPHQQQQQHNVKLEKRMSFANPSGSGNVHLKRSQTNAADLGLRLSAVQHFVNERQRFDASTNSLNAMAARSRSNIAALNWNFGEAELYTGQQRVPNPTNLSRATSFYQRDQIQSARSMGFLGPPCNKDLSRPLHVDCSVEYDLGNQPRIPKNSAPLLIIHPAYQQQRFHPYSSTTDFNGESSLTSHYSNEVSSTPSARWPSCRFTTGYHHNQHQQQQMLHQQQPKFDFEITQSAPPKPQHRITRHSSFLVGGGVTSRQVSQFRPIVPEDESSYFNHHQPYMQARSFAPCAEASTMTELLESHPSAAILSNSNYHQPQHQMSTSIKRSKSIHQTSRGFHLSMPDISLDENNSHFQHQRRLQMALRNNGQHQHPRSRARTNLEAKLEAARKLSSESRDSGTSLDSHPSDSVLNLMPSFIDEDDIINNDDSEICSVASPPQKSDSGTGHPSQAFSDSGLGTPSSLMDQDGIEPGTSYSSSNSSSSSTSNVSKWKSSVSGGSQVVWRAFVSSLKCMHF